MVEDKFIVTCTYSADQQTVWTAQPIEAWGYKYQGAGYSPQDAIEAMFIRMQLALKEAESRE